MPEQILSDLSKYIYLQENQKELILQSYGTSASSLGGTKIRKVSPGSTKEENWISCTPVCGNTRSKKYGFYGSPFWNKVADKNRILFNTDKEAEDAGYVLAHNGQ